MVKAFEAFHLRKMNNFIHVERILFHFPSNHTLAKSEGWQITQFCKRHVSFVSKHLPLSLEWWFNCLDDILLQWRNFRRQFLLTHIKTISDFRFSGTNRPKNVLIRKYVYNSLNVVIKKPFVSFGNIRSEFFQICEIQNYLKKDFSVCDITNSRTRRVSIGIKS